MKTIKITHIAAAALIAVVAACADTDMDGDDPDDFATGADTAATTEDTASSRTVVVELEPTEGSEVEGTVTLTDRGTGVQVAAELTGLTEGDHGFHIHENGDCSAPDASSAGDHFAPDDNPHGGPDDRPDEAHAGDMGNITADGSGEASFDREFADMVFDGDRGIAGRAIVVHSDADDLESQPSGDAGDRMACGVISEES